MIPVTMPAEPAEFDRLVRKQGLAHLREQGQDPALPPAVSTLWKLSRLGADGRQRTVDYWQLARDDLRTGYHNRCVYSCFVLEPERLADGRLQSTHSIDHFQPRSRSAAGLAYEWSNLRWAWRVIDNEGKGNNLIPADHDPTQMDRHFFKLAEADNGDWLVVPDAGLDAMEQSRLQTTIQRLGLNRPKVLLARNQYVKDFLENAADYGDRWMQQRQPFVFGELRRLGLI